MRAPGRVEDRIPSGEMSARLAVGAVVFREDGAVLLVQRGRPPREGTWSLPGGKVEPGETLAGAIEREMREETGLHVHAGPVVEVLTLASDGYRYEIHDLLCTLTEASRETDARPGDDARAVRWGTRENLESLGLSVEVLRVVEAARRLR
jgi:8-oxo-dGTP diphosphatase